MHEPQLLWRTQVFKVEGRHSPRPRGSLGCIPPVSVCGCPGTSCVFREEAAAGGLGLPGADAVPLLARLHAGQAPSPHESEQQARPVQVQPGPRAGKVASPDSSSGHGRCGWPRGAPR